ncbi:MAG: methyltransferase domain-containing protein [Rickettsiales bacterium]|nr:methyltransferase domain-containing protein [Rickettsiales bacterium]
MKSSTVQQQIRQDFSRAAAHYDQHATVQRAVSQQLSQLVRPFLSSTGRWLDVGCGTGAFQRDFIQCGSPKPQLFQLDGAFAMCQRAAANGCATVCADMHQLPLANATLDGVFSSLSLQWAAPMEAAILELRRVIKSGGMLAFSTLLPGTFSELEQAFHDIHETSRILHFHSAQQWEAALLAHGWRLHSSEHVMLRPSFVTAMDALRQVHVIGATAKTSPRPMTAATLRRLLKAYPLHTDSSQATPNETVQATYHVWLGLALAV